MAGVLRQLSVNATKRAHHKVRFKGHVKPAANVFLEQVGGHGWVVVARLKPSRHGSVHATESLPRGTTSWRFVVRGSAAYLKTTFRTLTLKR